jgi:hypothetical protein
MSSSVSGVSDANLERTARSLYSVPLLNATNFTTWKYRVQLVLKGRRLWKYVDGSTAAPSPTADLKEKDEWEESDQQAHSQIALTVSDSVISHLRNTTSAKEAWLKICSVFEQKGLAAKVFLRRKLLNLRKGQEPMQEHINTVRDLAEQLNAIGAPISDGDLAITLLCSLPETYDPIIIALESRDPKDVTFDVVAARLLAEELRQSESLHMPMSSIERAESALAVRAGAHKPKLGKACTFCGRSGHAESQCWDKHGKPNQASGSLSNGPYANIAYGF